MSQVVRKLWLTFEGDCQDQPCMWKVSRQFPELMFDIRQASVGSKIGIMALQFTGSEPDVEGAVAFLQSLGVHVDPVEGGSLVVG